MALISPIKLNIAEKLGKDKSFRERFFRGQAQDEIATSIRDLRGKRQMRQVDLANESGMKQSAISRIEQADYSGWSFTTLFRVADALDARLRVTFEPAEKVIEWYREKEAITSECEEYIKIPLSHALKDKAVTEHLSTTTSSHSARSVENIMLSTETKIQPIMQ